VTDAPSPGELSLRIDQVTMSLSSLVQRTEYTADKRFDERRFVDLEADVAEVRRLLNEEIKALRTSIDAATEKRGTNLKQAVYGGILPAVLVLMGIVVQIWLARQGA
jgi:hypothetical protein